MDPIYDALSLFKVHNTATERDCFYCPNKIDPVVNFQYITITIPTKENTHTFHLNCFEQLQWSMLNFWVRFIKSETKEIVH
jgi:hypothetical protein